MARYVLLPFLAALLLLNACTQEEKKVSASDIPLRFDSQGVFKIAQFTDLRWTDATPESKQTHAVIKHVLDTEQPDLAMVTGDVVTAPPAREGWLSIARIFTEAAVPWALTLGNHDDEAGMIRSEIFELLEGSPYFVSIRPSTSFLIN